MTLKLNGSSSGSVSIDAPASTTGGADVALTLPVNDGDADQYLQTNGSGALSFATVPAPITYATAQSASGTEIEFTGIPSTATKITVLLSGVGFDGNDDIQVKLGHSGGYYSTGYYSVGAHLIGTSISESASTSSFMIVVQDSVAAVNCVMEIYKLNDSATSAEWVECHSGADRNEYAKVGGGGLTGVTHTIDRLKVLLSGSNTFDAGKINVTWA